MTQEDPPRTKKLTPLELFALCKNAKEVRKLYNHYDRDMSASYIETYTSRFRDIKTVVSTEEVECIRTSYSITAYKNSRDCDQKDIQSGGIKIGEIHLTYWRYERREEVLSPKFFNEVQKAFHQLVVKYTWQEMLPIIRARTKREKYLNKK